MSIQSSDPEVKVIQELPSRKFWAETYVDLDSISNEATTAKVGRWAKKHRDPVGKGDLILEFEVEGQYGCIIEMRAESDGYMGPQLVEEGELLEKEQVATYITDAAEKRVAVSMATEAELMDKAGGSVQNLQDSLEEIESRRESSKADLAVAIRLACIHLKSSPTGTAACVRVPGSGDPNGGAYQVYVAPSESLPQEVTRDEIVTVENKGDGPTVARFQDVLKAALSSHPSAECVIIAQPPSATALSMIPSGLPGGVPNLNPHTVITEGGVVGLGSGDIVALPGFGVIVWGSSIDTAYCRLWDLERRSLLKLSALQTGISADKVTEPFESMSRGEYHTNFAALKRLLLRDDQSLPPV